MDDINSLCLEREVDWFEIELAKLISAYFDVGGAYSLTKAPCLEGDLSAYSNLVSKYKMGNDERAVLVLALLPHLKPQALDIFLMVNTNTGLPYTEFGGWRAKNHQGFLPTCETAAFILSANDIGKRLKVAQYFRAAHFFIENNILQIQTVSAYEPALSSALSISPECLSKLTAEVVR